MTNSGCQLPLFRQNLFDVVWKFEPATVIISSKEKERARFNKLVNNAIQLVRVKMCFVDLNARLRSQYFSRGGFLKYF